MIPIDGGHVLGLIFIVRGSLCFDLFSRVAASMLLGQLLTHVLLITL